MIGPVIGHKYVRKNATVKTEDFKSNWILTNIERLKAESLDKLYKTRVKSNISFYIYETC